MRWPSAILAGIEKGKPFLKSSDDNFRIEFGGRLNADFHAAEDGTQLLTGSKDWTLERLQAAAFDSYQPGFAELIPSLLKAYDALPRRDRRRAQLVGPIGALRGWNYRWSGDSVAQSLAMFWVDGLMKALAASADESINVTTTGSRCRSAARTPDQANGDTTPVCTCTTS